MDCMSLLGFSACAPDPDFRASLPFPAFDNARDAIPPLLRRRASPATQLAFSAAVRACAQADCPPATLPSIFASVAGEIQVTDQLCIELAKPDGLVSPSAFHNSVQNTAAGYWSIAWQCTQPASALAAGRDTFALGLLEAWCQLACQGGELLLVCYDETWPAHLVPGGGRPAFASAWVLAAGAVEGAFAHIGRIHKGRDKPEAKAFPPEWEALAERMPVLSAIPLLNLAAAGGNAQIIPVSSAASGWQVELQPLNPIENREPNNKESL
jgi:hypothetical protein